MDAAPIGLLEDGPLDGKDGFDAGTLYGNGNGDKDSNERKRTPEVRRDFSGNPASVLLSRKEIELVTMLRYARRLSCAAAFGGLRVRLQSRGRAGLQPVA
jgi:hypothetical protein